MNDETLTLYYYKDGLTKDERLAVTEALAADAELAARYSALCRQLSQLRADDSAALPADMLQRFHDTIERAAQLERGRQKPPSRVHFWSFAWGAAITAALAIGIGLGTWFAGSGSPEPMQVDDLFAETAPLDTAPDNNVVPAVFHRSMQNYLRESQREISGLPADAEADRLMMIMRLIEQNRLFEKAAERNDSPELARVLRAFEPILVRLASSDISPEDAAALRSQLSFELNVMLTKLARETSDGQQSNAERT